jgi:hypothetical protein
MHFKPTYGTTLTYHTHDVMFPDSPCFINSEANAGNNVFLHGVADPVEQSSCGEAVSRSVSKEILVLFLDPEESLPCSLAPFPCLSAQSESACHNSLMYLLILSSDPVLLFRLPDQNSVCISLSCVPHSPSHRLRINFSGLKSTRNQFHTISLALRTY